jgi:hypothetical protein
MELLDIFLSHIGIRPADFEKIYSEYSKAYLFTQGYLPTCELGYIKLKS